MSDELSSERGMGLDYDVEIYLMNKTCGTQSFHPSINGAQPVIVILLINFRALGKLIG
jgi:hypothetical protein